MDYTPFGDPLITYEILQTLSIFFTTGGGIAYVQKLALIGGIIGILVVVMRGMFSQKFEGQYFFGAMVLYLALFAPTDDLTVRNEIGAAVGTPVELPVGIVYSAGLISSVTSGIGNAYKNIMNPGQTYSTFDALRHLDRLRKFIINGDAIKAYERDPRAKYRGARITEYLNYCYLVMVDNTDSPAISARDIVLKDFFEAIKPNGYIENELILATQDDGVQTFQSCKEVYTSVNALYKTDAGVNAYMDGILGQWLLDEYQGIDATQAVSDMNTNLTRALVGRGGSAAENLKFMGAMYGVRHAQDMKANIGFFGGSALISSKSLVDGQETRNSKAATGAVLFGEIVEHYATIIECLAHSIFPFLVIILFSGSAGLSVFGKYLMFVLWVGMWQPLGVIVDSFLTIALNTTIDTGVLSARVENGSLEEYYMAYSEASKWLTIGSVMMTSVPMIAWALVKGGQFAATQFISGLDYGDAVSASEHSPTKGKIDYGNTAMANVLDGAAVSTTSSPISASTSISDNSQLSAKTGNEIASGAGTTRAGNEGGGLLSQLGDSVAQIQGVTNSESENDLTTSSGQHARGGNVNRWQSDDERQADSFFSAIGFGGKGGSPGGGGGGMYPEGGKGLGIAALLKDLSPFSAGGKSDVTWSSGAGKQGVETDGWSVMTGESGAHVTGQSGSNSVATTLQKGDGLSYQKTGSEIGSQQEGARRQQEIGAAAATIIGSAVSYDAANTQSKIASNLMHNPAGFQDTYDKVKNNDDFNSNYLPGVREDAPFAAKMQGAQLADYLQTRAKDGQEAINEFAKNPTEENRQAALEGLTKVEDYFGALGSQYSRANESKRQPSGTINDDYAQIGAGLAAVRDGLESIGGQIRPVENLDGEPASLTAAEGSPEASNAQAIETKAAGLVADGQAAMAVAQGATGDKDPAEVAANLAKGTSEVLDGIQEADDLAGIDPKKDLPVQAAEQLNKPEQKDPEGWSVKALDYEDADVPEVPNPSIAGEVADQVEKQAEAVEMAFSNSAVLGEVLLGNQVNNAKTAFSTVSDVGGDLVDGVSDIAGLVLDGVGIASDAIEKGVESVTSDVHEAISSRSNVTGDDLAAINQDGPSKTGFGSDFVVDKTGETTGSSDVNDLGDTNSNNNGSDEQVGLTPQTTGVIQPAGSEPPPETAAQQIDGASPYNKQNGKE